MCVHKIMDFLFTYLLFFCFSRLVKKCTTHVRSEFYYYFFSYFSLCRKNKIKLLLFIVQMEGDFGDQNYVKK